jgi:hypothetical protein
MKEKLEIPAIHDKEFITILTDLGLYESIISKKANCINCNELLTIENIGGIKVIENSPKLICDNSECLENE